MSVRTRRVAMLDSGLGGITVLNALRALAPDTDVIYFADTANVPYGDRALDDVATLGARIVDRLAQREPGVIVVASGTTCAAFDAHGWPSSLVPYTGVIDTGARTAVAASASGRIGVIATRGTIDSGCFERAVHALSPVARVTNVAAPALVPIVEAGESSTERAQAAVNAACRAFIDAHCDTVILGCTHFPHLRKWFAAALGPGVELVDPADACAAATVALLASEPLGSGRLICEVSGDEQMFARYAQPLGAPRIDKLVHIELPAVAISQPRSAPLQ
ncbi:MAG TPA: glutamate racemase [Candidatus Eremiobacteraceae bacterium]|nr:glutamate racemase [Candidatus Eremiobacteraceae bacterium]